MPSLRGIRQWPAAIPNVLWTPLTAVGLVLVVGTFGVIADQPWLYPSLGPSALVIAEFPGHQAARFRDVVLGHLIGLGAGLAAVWLVGADATAVITQEVSAERVVAAALAMAGTIIGLMVLRVSQTPAASTTLVVALGGLRPTLHDVIAVVVGVLILGACGEFVRRVRLNATQGSRDDTASMSSKDG
ncbi:MAG: HPP family protein [Dehalococcoidia bacterium]